MTHVFLECQAFSSQVYVKYTLYLAPSLTTNYSPRKSLLINLDRSSSSGFYFNFK